jgi:hypothetical protein
MIPKSDPATRRVVGAILLLVAIGLLVVLSRIEGNASFPYIAILAAGLAGGLGAGGLRLLIWPMGRHQS